MKIRSIFCISLLLVCGGVSEGSAQDRDRNVSFQFKEISLRAALDSLMRLYSRPIMYFDKDIKGADVSITCTDCIFEEALSKLLSGTRVGWKEIGNQVILYERKDEIQPTSSTISGTVRDSLTGDPIIGVNVMLYDSADQVTVVRWCPTNQFGFFSLRNVVPGKYTLVVRAVAFRPVVSSITVRTDVLVEHNIRMEQNEISLQEVTVEAQRTALSAAEGLSRGIFIRSTPSDQNQYLLDGARVYNPSHYGGVLSTFNGDALNEVHVKIGGVPPYYGGRIGSILDISLREGMLERFSGSVGTGSLSSQLTLVGPLTSTTSIMVSGRRGYPDVLLPHLQRDGTPSTQISSELIGKLTHRLSGSDVLSLTGYFNGDSYSNEVNGDGKRLTNHLSWGNATASLRWIGVASSSLFLQACAVYTRYDFTADHNLIGDALLWPSANFSSNYGIEDAIIRAHAEHYYDQAHTARGGVELIHHRMSGEIGEFSSQIADLSLRGFSSWELSVYLQDQWRVLPGVSAELGARATNFIGNEGTFSGVDPRFSLLVSVDENLRLYLALTSINQFVHPYRNSGLFIFYPTIFWYPSTEKMRPSTSLQLSIGIEKNLGEGDYTMSAEPYYRITRNLHEFGFDTKDAQTRNLSDVILLGTGKVYGAELSLRKRTGKLSGWLTYNLSWATHRFAELNEGKPYAPRLSRRHEVQMTLWYALDATWMFGALCVLASNQSPSFTRKIARSERADPQTLGSIEFVDLNGGRLPGFQRLELRVHYRFSLGNYPLQLSLRLLNGYGLLDPYVWELREDQDVRLRWKATLDEPRLFPIYPTLGLVVKF